MSQRPVLGSRAATRLPVTATDMTSSNSSSSTELIRICATPDSGLWSSQGLSAPLDERVSASGGNFSVPCDMIGEDPRVRWSDEDDDVFPITGFSAEMLLVVMDALGPGYECVVDLLPTVRNSFARAPTSSHIGSALLSRCCASLCVALLCVLAGRSTTSDPQTN